MLGALFMSSFLSPQLDPFFSVPFIEIVKQQFVNFCGFEAHGSMGAAGGRHTLLLLNKQHT